MKKTMAAILSGLAAWLLLLAMLLSGVFVCTTSTAFYEHEYAKYDNANTIGVSDETLMSITRGLLDYLWGSRDTLDMQAEIGGSLREVFTQREKDHMVDVLFLIELARYALVVSAVGGIAAWVGAALLVRRERRGLRVCGIGYLVGAVSLMIAVGLVVLLAMQDFTAVFIKFHEIFFTNDLWLLSADDMLIMMVPEPFFVDCAALIALMFAAGIVITCVIAVWMICSGRNKRYEDWDFTEIGGAQDGDRFYRIPEEGNDGERPDASEIFQRMGLDSDEEEEDLAGEIPFAGIPGGSVVRHPGAYETTVPVRAKDDELSVRFEMKLDLKVEKSEDGRLQLVMDPDKKPQVSLSSKPGRLAFTVYDGGEALQDVEEEAPLQPGAFERAPMIAPAPSPEELLQQMDELMKGFPRGTKGEDA